jgi:hypothetical protein
MSEVQKKSVFNEVDRKENKTMRVILVIITVLEIWAGIAVLVGARSAFHGVTGVVLLGFGFLTLAVFNGTNSIVNAIEKRSIAVGGVGGS